MNQMIYYITRPESTRERLAVVRERVRLRERKENLEGQVAAHRKIERRIKTYRETGKRRLGLLLSAASGNKGAGYEYLQTIYQEGEEKYGYRS